MSLLKKFGKPQPMDDQETIDYGSDELPALNDPDDVPASQPTVYPTYSTGKGSSVNLKLFSPKSHKEAIDIADEVMKKCIVVLDISELPSDSSMRLIDFLAGVVHVLGGKLERMNNGTFIVAPNGVDIGELMAGDKQKN